MESFLSLRRRRGNPGQPGQGEIALVKPAKWSALDGGGASSESDGDSEFEEDALENVSYTVHSTKQRKTANGEPVEGSVPHSAVLLGISDAHCTGVNLFSLNAANIAETVDKTIIDSEVIEKAALGLAVADIPYGVTKEDWDVKAWGTNKVRALARWVKEYGTVSTEEADVAFTLVIFCSLE